MEVTGSEELREFLDSWQDDPLNIKKSFTEYMKLTSAVRGKVLEAYKEISRMQF